MASAARLYTPAVLALATGLAALPLDPAMPHQGAARSPSCGSTLALSLATDAGGRVTGIGLRAQACAIGQASAALFAAGVPGRSRAEIAQAAAALARWLAGEGPAPDWPGLDTIAAAAAYPARHGAILLAWNAALAALSPPTLPPAENPR